MIKNSELVKSIYQNVYSFCRVNGYIAKLRNSLKIVEGERFDQKNISDVGLDILDAIHCVEDKHRSMFLMNEVIKNIKPKNFVIEAGVGTGLLSFVVAAKKAKVVGLEINKDVFTLAQKIKLLITKRLNLDGLLINFLQTDALKYIPEQKADMIISENIYTGMFYEKQIQIMNHLRKYLKKDGIVVPLGLRMGIYIAETNFLTKPKPGELFVPDQLGGKLKVKPLSQSVIYSILNFSKSNKILVDKKINFKIIENGIANSVLIWTEVLLKDDKIIGRQDTTFLNSDIIIATSFSKQIQKGNKIKMKVKYKFGSKPKNAIFSLINL